MFQQVTRFRRLEKREKNKRTQTPLPPPSPLPCTQALLSGNCAWRPLWMGFWFLYPGPWANFLSIKVAWHLQTPLDPGRGITLFPFCVQTKRISRSSLGGSSYSM